MASAEQYAWPRALRPQGLTMILLMRTVERRNGPIAPLIVLIADSPIPTKHEKVVFSQNGGDPNIDPSIL